MMLAGRGGAACARRQLASAPARSFCAPAVAAAAATSPDAVARPDFATQRRQYKAQLKVMRKEYAAEVHEAAQAHHVAKEAMQKILSQKQASVSHEAKQCARTCPSLFWYGIGWLTVFGLAD